MMNRPIIFSLLMSVFAGIGHGQSGRLRSGEGVQQTDKDSVRLRVEEVLLPISVRNDIGNLPTYLERSDFIVTEDGKRQEVTSIQHTPANLLLILDASGASSTFKDINVHRDLAMKILDGLGADDRAAIITYAEKTTVVSAWTSDKAALQRSLQQRFRPGLESSLYDSLIYGAENLLASATGRRSVVLITDGINSSSSNDFEKVLGALHRARATVYVVAQNRVVIEELKPLVFNKLAWFQMLDPQQRKRFERLREYSRALEAAEVTLQRLTEETGGAMWNPRKREELEAVDALSRRVANEIGSEYVIAYSSNRRSGDDAFHPINVYVTRGDLRVRTRRGIYSTLNDPARAEDRKR